MPLILTLFYQSPINLPCFPSQCCFRLWGQCCIESGSSVVVWILSAFLGVLVIRMVSLSCFLCLVVCLHGTLATLAGILIFATRLPCLFATLCLSWVTYSLLFPEEVGCSVSSWPPICECC